MSNPKVELHIAGYGVVTIELDAAKAPKTVENFLAYVDAKFYDDTIFHRVISDFMIQGGGSNDQHAARVGHGVSYSRTTGMPYFFTRRWM